MYLKGLIFFCIFSLIHLILLGRFSRKLNSVALFWSILILIYNNIFLLLFNKTQNFQVYYSLDWIYKASSINWGDILITVDGISVFFISLSIILIPICIMMSWNAIENFKKEFLISLFSILLLLFLLFTYLCFNLSHVHYRKKIIKITASMKLIKFPLA